MYHLGAVARLKDGQIGNQDSFEINSALGASAGALGKLISRNSTDLGSLNWDFWLWIFHRDHCVEI